MYTMNIISVRYFLQLGCMHVICVNCNLLSISLSKRKSLLTCSRLTEFHSKCKTFYRGLASVGNRADVRNLYLMSKSATKETVDRFIVSNTAWLKQFFDTIVNHWLLEWR